MADAKIETTKRPSSAELIKARIAKEIQEQADRKKPLFSAADSTEMKDYLRANMSRLAIYLLGTPNKGSPPGYYRYGSKTKDGPRSNISICVEGSQAGGYKDFYGILSIPTGGPIELTMAVKNTDFAGAMKILREWRRMPDPFAGKAKRTTLTAPSAAAAVVAKATTTATSSVPVKQEPTKNQIYGLELWAQASPIEGTLSELYLNNRAIRRTDWSDLRHHPNVYNALGGYGTNGRDGEPCKQGPALISAYRQSQNGPVVAIQARYYDAQGVRLDIEVPKRTFGSSHGAVTYLRQAAAGIYIIAEGLESTASSWSFAKEESFGAIACNAAGELAKMTPPDDMVGCLIIADNDIPFQIGDRWVNPGRDARTTLMARLGEMPDRNIIMIPVALPQGVDPNAIAQKRNDDRFIRSAARKLIALVNGAKRRAAEKAAAL